MVRKFLEALFLSRPPRIVKFIWSVAAVLDMLRECGPVRESGRPKFSLRAMLLAWRAIALYAYWWKSYVSVKRFLALHSYFRNKTGSTRTYFTFCGDIQTMIAWITSNYYHGGIFKKTLAVRDSLYLSLRAHISAWNVCRVSSEGTSSGSKSRHTYSDV